LLRILFKLLSEGETFPDYETALDSPRIQYLYKADPFLTSGYDTICGELILTYLRKNPKFVECVFKKLVKEEYKKIHDYLDDRIEKLKKIT